jgi:hypothetical protein
LEFMEYVNDKQVNWIWISNGINGKSLTNGFKVNKDFKLMLLEVQFYHLRARLWKNVLKQTGARVEDGVAEGSSFFRWSTNGSDWIRK